MYNISHLKLFMVGYMTRLQIFRETSVNRQFCSCMWFNDFLLQKVILFKKFTARKAELHEKEYQSDFQSHPKLIFIFLKPVLININKQHIFLATEVE